MKTTLKTLLLLVIFACFFMPQLALAFNSKVASQSVLNSALSRSQTERFAPSQLGSDPFTPWLATGNTSLAFGVRPQLFVATQNNMSQIVAGGTLNVTGAAVDNRQLTVTADSTRTGTAYTWKQYDHGCGGLKGCDYNYQAYGGSAYSLTVPQTITLGTGTAVGSVSTASLSSNALIAARTNVSAITEVSTSALKTSLITQDLKAANVTASDALNATGRAVNLSSAPAANASLVTVTAGNTSGANVTANTSAVSTAVANVTTKTVTTNATSSNVTVTAGNITANANNVTVTAANASSANITGVNVVPNIASNGSVANGTHVNYAANRTAVGSPTYTLKNVGTTVSNNSLFRTPANSTARYFVETDPKFTNYKSWLSSDYMIAALGLDPQATQKRLGDGFYEQKLVREQVLALTGTRFLDGYADDETQYADLMNNAVTFAKSYNLRPGIALSDEQMAALTSDIVWLVTKSVTLPDGSVVQALVPQLYTKLRSGDLNESGALLGGTNVVMNLTGDANNLGTIAGRNIVSLTANNINNMNSVSGNVVSLDAKTDINVIGGQVQASSALYANAGRNINVASTATASDQSKAFTYKGIDRVAGLYVGATNGTLAMTAGGNINLTAANIINSGLNSTTSIQAGGNINLATIQQGSSNSVIVEAGKQFLKDGQTSEVGTSIIGGGNVSMSGTNVNLRAANIQAGVASNSTNNGTGALVIAALNNINVTAGVATQDYAFADKKKIGGGGLFGSDGETVTIKTSNNTFAQGSNLGGNTVALQAGSFTGNGTQATANSTLGNINVVGSNILSTNGTNLIATGNVSVTNAVNTFNSTFYQQTTESGFLSGGGGIGVTYGDRTQRQTNNQSGTSAAASTIGATNGSINIAA
jgi:filamentous hemagglutinin